MPAKISQRDRKHLEIAFESSGAIVNLAGLQGSEQYTFLFKQIIDGELTFDEAALIVLTACAVKPPIKI